jgi:alanyl-tRNA synthetase
VADAIAESAGIQMVVLDRTPFYAESGGQVGDTGTIVGPEGTFQVTDVQKSGDVILHYGRVTRGRLARGQAVAADVDSVRRGGIERAHSATHILHYALQRYLGEHATQRGSRVEEDQLRFDFANLEAVSPAHLETIERETIGRIREGAPVRAEILPLEEARGQGAMMLFGEKYPDPVRMVTIGSFSKELCGGTHVANSSEIGEFEIASEEAVSAGTRRIVALTGDRARRHAQETLQVVLEAARIVGESPRELVQGVERLMKEIKSLKKMIDFGGGKRPAESPPAKRSIETSADDLAYFQIRETARQLSRLLNEPVSQIPTRLESMLAERQSLEKQFAELGSVESLSADDLLARAFDAEGITVIVSEVPGANIARMRTLIDQIRQRNSSAAVFLASIEGTDRITMLAGLGREVVARGFSAGQWAQTVASTVGGRGGGKPDMAQAGGKQPEKINDALDAARQFMLTATAT